MRESDIQNRVLLAAGSLPGVRLFRNTVGQGWHGRVMRHDGDVLILQNPRRVTFGLCPGSADLIGWQSVTITSDMIGQPIAQFIGLEVKTSMGRASDGQSRFLQVLQGAGGMAEIVTSAERALQLFGAQS